MPRRGIFSPPPLLRAPECDCDCDGCCGVNFKDYPDIIYVTFEYNDGTFSETVSARMYKQLTTTSSACKQNSDCYGGLAYHSDLALLTYQPVTNIVQCCAWASLWVTCADGECTWSYFFAQGDDHCTEDSDPGLPIDISCLVEGTTTFDLQQGDLCFDTDENHPKIYITFSETNPGGDFTPCDKLCCDPPDTLYVTLESDCPQLDGQVIIVTRAQSSCPVQFPPPPYNANGESDITWSGSKTICECARSLNVRVTSKTWSSNNPACKWGLSIETCFVDSDVTPGETKCLPITFTGDWVFDEIDTECNGCCFDMESFTVTATVTE